VIAFQSCTPEKRQCDKTIALKMEIEMDLWEAVQRRRSVVTEA
jgi:hypothetical protein